MRIGLGGLSFSRLSNPEDVVSLGNRIIRTRQATVNFFVALLNLPPLTPKTFPLGPASTTSLILIRHSDLRPGTCGRCEGVCEDGILQPLA